MKRNLTILTALGLLLPCLLPSLAVADGNARDLERLYWICSDYQLPVRGYVVEGWFSSSNWVNRTLETELKKQFAIETDSQRIVLQDGSIWNSQIQNQKQNCFVELQLITENLSTAQQYYQRLQEFWQRYGIKKPLGITLIIDLPELLDDAAMKQLGGELLQGLEAKQIDCVSMEQGVQISGYSPQLFHQMQIGAQCINVNLAMMRQEERTVLYLGCPIIYQQY